jgi:hypothetical protein
MLHFSWHVGHVLLWASGNQLVSVCSTIVEPMQTPKLVLLAAFPRTLSSCYPLLYRPPVLRLLCANETCSAKWTICVACWLLLYLCIGKGKGKPMCSENHTELQALLLPGRIRASVVGIVTAQLRILLSTLLLDMKHDATNRFIRDSMRCCYNAQRFFQLQHTMYDCRPEFSGDTVFWIFRPWLPVLEKRRVASLK